MGALINYLSSNQLRLALQTAVPVKDVATTDNGIGLAPVESSTNGRRAAKSLVNAVLVAPDVAAKPALTVIPPDIAVAATSKFTIELAFTELKDAPERHSRSFNFSSETLIKFRIHYVLTIRT